MTLDLPTGPRGRALAVALLFCVAAIIWFGIGGPLLGWYADRADLLEERRTMLDRMTQVAGTLPELRREAAGLSHDGAAHQALLPGSTDALAGAALQERLQTMAAQAEAPISSAEVLPTIEAGSSLRRIGVRISVRATMANVARLLAAIERASPRMLVDELELHGQFLAAKPNRPALSASLIVYGFRAAGTDAPVKAQ